MAATNHDPFLGGETDLQEVFDLCNNYSGDLLSTSPDASSSASGVDEDWIQSATAYTGYQTGDYANDLSHTDFEYLFTPETWDSNIELHVQRCQQMQEFGIHLGISSSLAKPMRNHSSYPQLDQELRKELVALYFNHVHPLCPIIDEQCFWWHFIILSEAEFFETFPAIMFNAMLFSAFAHATDDQVRRAGSTSVFEIQSQYFNLLSGTYDDAWPQVSCETDEVVLAKTALLLSFWCPPKLEIALDILWVNRAIYHTQRYLQDKTIVANVSSPMPKRRDILVWSCVARNTFISYAMRRPNRLCLEEALLCEPDAMRAEFDRELESHSFCSPAAKVRMVEDFITLCKLSRNLRGVLYPQRSSPPPSIGDVEITEFADPDATNNKLHAELTRYLKTSETETQLLDMVDMHERVKYEHYIANSGRIGSSEHAPEIIAARVRSYVLQIMTFSSIVSLYLATLSASSGSSWARSCHFTAQAKLLDASRKVVCIVEHMLSDVPIEAIPGRILTWIIIPMIPLLVEQHCTKFGLPGLASSDFVVECDNEDDSLARLLLHTSRLESRFYSARDASGLLQNVDRTLHLYAACTTTGGESSSMELDDQHSCALLKWAMAFLETEIGDGNCVK